MRSSRPPAGHRTPGTSDLRWPACPPAPGWTSTTRCECRRSRAAGSTPRATSPPRTLTHMGKYQASHLRRRDRRPRRRPRAHRPRPFQARLHSAGHSSQSRRSPPSASPQTRRGGRPRRPHRQLRDTATVAGAGEYADGYKGRAPDGSVDEDRRTILGSGPWPVSERRRDDPTRPPSP